MDIGSFKVSGAAVPTQVTIRGMTPPSTETAPAEVQAADANTGTQEASAPVAAESQPLPEKPAERVDTRFSALARKEAQLHKAREQLKAEKAAVEEAARQAAEFNSLRENARLNPIKALEALGLNYEQITEFVMNDNKPTPNAEVQSVREELERFIEQQKEAQKQAEEIAVQRLTAEQDSVLEAFRSDAIGFVSANPERYELTTADDAAYLVPEVIEQHFVETGELMPIEKAADLVEAFLDQKAQRYAATKKFQARMAPAQKPVVEPAAAELPAAKRSASLSNALTASVATTANKPRSDQDRIRAALARLEGR